LHEFTDALHADSQSEGNLSVSKTFRPQQHTLALFWRELRKRVFETPHSLVQKDLLFGTRPGVRAFSNRGTGLFVVDIRTTKLRAVDIHGKIVSDTKYPGAKIVSCIALEVITDEPEKRFLDDVFRLIQTHAKAAKIRSQRWSQMIVEINDALASFRAAGLFGNKDFKLARYHPISFRAGTSQRSAKFVKDFGSHLPSKTIANVQETQTLDKTDNSQVFQGVVKYFSSFSTPSTRAEEQIAAGHAWRRTYTNILLA
jgi:hypothetical protein